MNQNVRWHWIRWRLLVGCFVVAAVPQLILGIQALIRARQIRSMGSDQVIGRAADYLVGATLSGDTFGTLLLWTLELTVLFYGLALIVLYVRNRFRPQADA
jgi:hypothetical protein